MTAGKSGCGLGTVHWGSESGTDGVFRTHQQVAAESFIRLRSASFQIASSLCNHRSTPSVLDSLVTFFTTEVKPLSSPDEGLSDSDTANM